MIKRIRLFLLSTLAMVFGSAFANAQTTVTWDASSKDAMPNISVGSDLTLAFAEGSADQTPGYTTQSKKTVVSMQSGSKLTVAGADENVTISKIVFTFVGDNLGLTPNVGTSINSFADNTSTWTGEANSIEFKATGRRYVQTIEVTYTGSAAPVVKAPVLAITQDGIADTYDMDQNGVFVVYYENQGNAAAENAKLTLYVDGAENASKAIGTLNFGASNLNFWNAKYDLTNLAAGEHQVYVELTADNAEGVKTEAKTVNFTKKAAEPTFEITVADVEVQLPVDNIVVKATVKNTSEVDAAEVVVNLWRNGVVATYTIDALAAGASEEATFTIDALEAGEYSMQVLTADNKYGASFTVTVKAEPEADKIDMAITAVQGAKTIDLAGENVYTVFYQNKGNVKVENAEIKLIVNDNEAGSETVTVEAGQSGSVKFTLDVANLFDAGEDLGLDATIEGFVNVDGDVDATNNKSSMTATVTKTVAEATYEVAAQAVEVEFGAETFDVVATVKNTSEVAAQNVEVKLFSNSVIATETIEAIAAGAEATVTFKDVVNPFTKAGDYTMQIIVGKALGEVKVTVKPEPVAQVVDMAITAIQGLSEIDLQAENKVQVWYKNEGNVDLQNVAINFDVNDAGNYEPVVVDEVKAGKSGYVEFTIDLEDFVDYEEADAQLIAWVNIDGDTVAENNKVTKTVAVVSGEVAEPEFQIVAEGVTVEYGAESFELKATVVNTSDVDATDVEVTLFHHAIIATNTIKALAAGAQTEVTFIVEATEEAPFQFGRTVSYYVQAPGTQAEVEVVFKAEPVAEVVDMAIIAIQGLSEINLQAENKVRVWYQNEGNVDLQNVAINFDVNDAGNYEPVVVDEVKAGTSGYVEFTIDLEDFVDYEEADAQLIAWVNIDGDAVAENNKVTKTVAVVKGIADSIAAIKAKYGEHVQIFTLDGKKVDSVRKGQVYIINGKKVAVK